MTQEIINDVNKLVEIINGCEIDGEYKGYLASPHLEVMVDLILNNLDDSRESLSYAYDTLIFIADRYMMIGRLSLSAIYNKKSLEVGLMLFDKYGKMIPHDIEKVYSKVLHDRNYYVDDDCEDILLMLKGKGIIDVETLLNIYNKRMKSRRTLKNDPIEMSDKYLEVIDEVEEMVDKNRKTRGMGSCHEMWALKAKYLKEKGIIWRSLAIMNPRMRFD